MSTTDQNSVQKASKLLTPEIQTHRITHDFAVISLEIAMKVKSGTGHEPFRPYISKDACVGALHALITQCWDEDPGKRPGFDTIKSVVRNIHG